MDYCIKIRRKLQPGPCAARAWIHRRALPPTPRRARGRLQSSSSPRCWPSPIGPAAACEAARPAWKHGEASGILLGELSRDTWRKGHRSPGSPSTRSWVEESLLARREAEVRDTVHANGRSPTSFIITGAAQRRLLTLEMKSEPIPDAVRAGASVFSNQYSMGLTFPASGDRGRQ
jgi:hypothetical protein